MDKTQNCKDTWANIFFYTFFSMTENSEASTKLLSRDSAVAKNVGLIPQAWKKPSIPDSPRDHL